MGLLTGNTVVQGDFITKSQRNGTPSNDSGRVPKMESDGRVSEDHMEAANAIDIVIGEAFTGATTPQPAYIDKSTGKAMIADANVTTKMKFVGFVNTTGSTNDTERLIVSGIVRGFSGLTAGEKYYLSDTAGTISTTPGTNEILVGIALSATTLLIQKGKRYMAGVTSFSSTTTLAIDLGFRPSIVRVHATISAGVANGSSNSFGSWSQGGGQKCSYAHDLSGTSVAGTASGNSWLVNVGGGNQHSGTITSVTDTGFTLSNSEDSGTLTVYIYWEAEGEL